MRGQNKFVVGKFHSSLNCNKTRYGMTTVTSNKNKLRLSITYIHIPHLSQYTIIVIRNQKRIVMLVAVCLFALFNCCKTLKQTNFGATISVLQQLTVSSSKFGSSFPTFVENIWVQLFSGLIFSVPRKICALTYTLTNRVVCQKLEI